MPPVDMKSSWNNHKIGSPAQMIFSFTVIFHWPYGERTIILRSLPPSYHPPFKPSHFSPPKRSGNTNQHRLGTCFSFLIGALCASGLVGVLLLLLGSGAESAAEAGGFASRLGLVVKWDCWRTWPEAYLSAWNLQALKLFRPTRSIAVSAIQPLKVSKYKLLLSVYVEDIIVSGSRCFIFSRIANEMELYRKYA